MRPIVVCLCTIFACISSYAFADPLTWGDVVTRTANGCDAFTPVLGPDRRHYTGFGDCGGLTGTLPKLSMGLGRFSGGPANVRVEDVPTSDLSDYGNRDAGQKPSSAIIVGSRMYMWVRNYGPNGTQARLKYSDDFTKSCDSKWTWAPVILTNFGYPVFVQAAPGSYVYIVAHDNNSAYFAANRFVLLRVLKSVSLFLYPTDIGLVQLDSARQPVALETHHGAAQLLQHRPGGLVAGEPELALQLQRREARRVGGDEVGGGEPERQGQPGAVQDGAGRHRGLAPARPALQQIAGGQKVAAVVAARRATKAVRRAAGHEIVPTGLVGREPGLKLRQAEREDRPSHDRGVKTV